MKIMKKMAKTVDAQNKDDPKYEKCLMILKNQ